MMYKDLLDYKNTCSVDVKQKDYIDVSKYTPVVISNNDRKEDLKKILLDGHGQIQDHCKAIMRRIQLVEFFADVQQLHKFNLKNYKLEEDYYANQYNGFIYEQTKTLRN